MSVDDLTDPTYLSLDAVIMGAALRDNSPEGLLQLQRIIYYLPKDDALTFKCSMIVAIKNNQPVEVFKIAGSKEFAEEDKYDVAVLLNCASEIMAGHSCTSERLSESLASSPDTSNLSGFEGNTSLEAFNIGSTCGVTDVLLQGFKTKKIKVVDMLPIAPSSSASSPSSVFNHSITSYSWHKHGPTDQSSMFGKHREKFTVEAVQKLKFYFDALSGRGSDEQLEQIAAELKTSPKRVKVWFKNRRAKVQRAVKDAERGQFASALNVANLCFRS